MAVLDGASTTEACKQSRKCSKVAGHRGRCNSEKPINPLWESSSVFKLNTRKRKLIDKENQLYEQHEAKREMLDEREETLKTTELAIHTKLREKGKTHYLWIIPYHVISFDYKARQDFIFNLHISFVLY